MKLFILVCGLACQIFASAALSSELPIELQGLGLREAASPSRDLEGWMPPKKIVVQSVFGIDAVEMLQATAPNAKIVQVKSAEEAAFAIDR
jgi:hypothetical protein